ncbi:MAG: flagellar motor protein MotB [Halodesulfovibrio sp.]
MKSHLKRLRKRHEEGEEWAVSFADMMTLLMCFFILMVSISAVDIERYEQVAESLGLAMKKTPLDRTRPETGALRDTITEQKGGRTQTAPDMQPDAGSNTGPDVQADMQPDKQPEKQPDAAEQPVRLQAQVPDATPSAGADEIRSAMVGAHEAAAPGTRQESARQELVSSGNAALDALMSGLEERLQGAGSAMQIERRANSVAIRLHGPVFFALASAELTQASLPFLDRVAEELKGNRLHVSVEGHTDDLPIVSDRFPSNWELSAGRAASVARHLIGQGVEATRLDVRGYAHVRPLVPNLDAHGSPIPGNRELNRRVMIVISTERENTL